jgi:hypothetical protein
MMYLLSSISADFVYIRSNLEAEFYVLSVYDIIDDMRNTISRDTRDDSTAPRTGQIT